MAGWGKEGSVSLLGLDKLCTAWSLSIRMLNNFARVPSAALRDFAEAERAWTWKRRRWGPK